MVLLESGPARTDSIWNGAFTLLCIGMAAWFFYDGAIGWVAKNREVAKQKLTALWDAGQKIPDAWGDNPADPANEAAAVRAANPSKIADVEARLGKAKLVKTSGPETVHFYISDYGSVEVPVTNGVIQVDRIRGATWGHTRDDIQRQYYWAILPILGLLYILPKFLRSATLRCSIDDDGMTYGGRRIPFAAMTAFKDYSPKGWVDLHYDTGSAATHIRIDNQKIAKFDEIIALVCEKKGFVNPLLEEDDGDEPELDSEPDAEERVNDNDAPR